eukprot:TRINITY_DN4262_c0_g1_i4.p1 TRINITY_DN4262_c0_g1~~TRINITY_DN4262_c0_g1_i4.p1  ORF type:complete len:211 (-),score=42.61 TRINITY_DN4262_c0_g1_i4:121-753(-)
MRNKSRRNIFSVCCGSMLFCSVLYIVLGVTLGCFFGDVVSQSIVLNWETYKGITKGWKSQGSADWSAPLVILIVQAYPVLAVVSGFPLLATPLVGTLMGWVPSRLNNSVGSHRWWHLLSCAAVCFPPVVASLFMRQLDVILILDGAGLFVLLYIVPCVLFYLSKWRVQQAFGPHAHVTKYSGPHSWTGLTHVVLVLSVLCLAFYLHSCIP